MKRLKQFFLDIFQLYKELKELFNSWEASLSSDAKIMMVFTFFLNVLAWYYLLYRKDYLNELVLKGYMISPKNYQMMIIFLTFCFMECFPYEEESEEDKKLRKENPRLYWLGDTIFQDEKPWSFFPRSFHLLGILVLTRLLSFSILFLIWFYSFYVFSIKWVTFAIFAALIMPVGKASLFLMVKKTKMMVWLYRYGILPTYLWVIFIAMFVSKINIAVL